MYVERFNKIVADKILSFVKRQSKNLISTLMFDYRMGYFKLGKSADFWIEEIDPKHSVIIINNE